jgi:hypothetical protein
VSLKEEEIFKSNPFNFKNMKNKNSKAWARIKKVANHIPTFKDQTMQTVKFQMTAASRFQDQS